jgi:transcriptional regulator with XRE-family HTH domain
MGNRDKAAPSGFGAILRALRDRRGITQQQLADAVQHSLSMVVKIEAGTSEPSWPLAVAFADALGVSVAEFVPEPGMILNETEDRPRGRPRKVTDGRVKPQGDVASTSGPSEGKRDRLGAKRSERGKGKK